MSKPDAPTPPSPIATAAAQTGTNVSTGVANAFLNNVNQVTPTGNLNYDVTGNYAWTDPSTGQSYSIPRFTATQVMTPQGQAIQGQQLATQYNLAGMANAQSQNIAQLLSQPMNLSGAPTAGSAQGILGVPGAATSYNTGGPIQSSLNLTGDANQSNIQNTYGTNFDVASVQKALMGQMQPQLDIQKQQQQQQLADQGIRYGSQAYNNAMTPFNQQENNAWMQSITGATGQQAQQMQMAGAQAAFQNAAQQQAYEQQLGQASFGNAAQGQQYQQNAALAAFGNAGLAQQIAQQQAGFNAAQTARNQYMQEQYAQRNQPINETSALLSGSQVQSVPWLNSPNSQIPTTDFAGITNQNFQNQLGVYNAQTSQYNTLMGGILGLGAGALKGGYVSDRREKENIKPLGSVLAAEPEGPKMGTVFSTHVDADVSNTELASMINAKAEKAELPIYQYSYKADPTSARHIGPMAQDVEKIDPKAVKEIGGVKHIDPVRVMGSILRAA